MFNYYTTVLNIFKLPRYVEAHLYFKRSCGIVKEIHVNLRYSFIDNQVVGFIFNHL